MGGALVEAEPEFGEGDGSEPNSSEPWWNQLITVVVVVLPLAVLAVAIWIFWHRGIGWFDIVLGATLYVITGLGISLGFHRHFTHRSFRARRPLRIALGVAGSLAAEGSLISWVSHHRRHHVYADQAGDPHSPWAVDHGSFRRLRGLFHAHVGWLFSGVHSNPNRWSRDLLGDRDVVMISNLAPLWMVLSLALPFAIGWAITGSIVGAALALVWAGLVRIALLHHVTWSVNSFGHMFGKRPYQSGDQSGNIAWLSVVSFGDSWHNSHHAFPALARHGCDRGQLDPSASVLRLFEGLGWASQVKRPTSSLLNRRRCDPMGLPSRSPEPAHGSSD